MIIDNPCYQCYMGAIGECIRCNYYGNDWSGDIDSKTIDVDSSYIMTKEKEPESMFEAANQPIIPCNYETDWL